MYSRRYYVIEDDITFNHADVMIPFGDMILPKTHRNSFYHLLVENNLRLLLYTKNPCESR